MLTERATAAATTDDSSTATNIGVVNDWLREGWKDVHMDWLLLRQEVGMAQAQLQESYLHGTHEVRRLVSEGKEQGQHQLKRKWQVIQHHQQRLLQEDVPQLVALGKSFKTILLERRRGKESTPPLLLRLLRQLIRPRRLLLILLLQRENSSNKRFVTLKQPCEILFFCTS